MKKLIVFLCSFLMTAISLSAQEAVPAAVKTAFENQYSTIEEPFWEQREGAMCALFKYNGQLTKVFYEFNGQQRETRVRTSLDALPFAVKVYVNNHFQDADITYVGLVVKPGQPAVYRVESELESAVHIKLFDEGGSLLRQELIPYSTD